jgi:hypothetical protein
MSRLRLVFALVLFALALVVAPSKVNANRCPGAFYTDDTGTCGFTGQTCGGGAGCMYDCEQGSGCYGPW